MWATCSRSWQASAQHTCRPMIWFPFKARISSPPASTRGHQGGQDESRASELPEWVERRLDACASLLNSQRSQTKVLCSGGGASMSLPAVSESTLPCTYTAAANSRPRAPAAGVSAHTLRDVAVRTLLLLTPLFRAPAHGSYAGTPHKQPILGPSGFCTFESMACAAYLMGKGVPADALLKETASYDTIGNGYFAATVHALPRRWQSLCVVTSDFHMPRSRVIFQTLFDLVEKDFGHGTDLHFVEVSDAGIFTDDVLAARKEREQKSLDRFVEDMRGIDSLAGFSEWLHDTHLCYAVSRQHEIGMSTGVSDKALASY